MMNEEAQALFIHIHHSAFIISYFSLVLPGQKAWSQRLVEFS
jgi:hypothetical protein